jgi:hypothetical protein
MKQYFFASILTAICSLFAVGSMAHAETLTLGVGTEQKNQEIYEALSAPEQSGSPSLGAETSVKSVGGLTCQKTTIVAPGANSKYSCAASSLMDAKSIYEALNVDEKDVVRRDRNGNPSLGSVITAKRTSGLQCRKMTVVVPGAKPNYVCFFTF